MTQNENVTLRANIMKSGIFTNIGFALVLVGVPLGMYMNFMFPQALKWSNAFMIVSVLLIIDYKNLFTRKFPSFNKVFIWILAFQLLMLFYGFFSDNISSQLFSFHLYIIALIISLSTNSNRLNYDRIIIYTFIFSSICVLLGIYFISQGLIVFSEELWNLRQEDESYFILESFTVSNGAVINVICSLFLFAKHNRKRNLFALLFIALSFYVLFAVGKRTPIVVSIFAILFFLYKNAGINRNLFWQSIKFSLLSIILIVVLYLSIDATQITVDKFWHDLSNGILNILGNTSTSDNSDSAMARYEFRLWAYDYIKREFNVFNFIFGAGYMTKWLDNPILQSYLDMGVLGILFYVGLVLVFPIRTLCRKRINTLVFFAALLCLYNVSSAINSGHPYQYFKYTYIVLLAFLIKVNKEKN